MLVEEYEASVLYRSEYNPYFKTGVKLFPTLEFLVQLLQHLPDPRSHLVHRYRFYSSRSRGTWMRKPYLVRLAPERWKQPHSQHCVRHFRWASEDCTEQSRTAWARLLAEVYEVDALRGNRCGYSMKVPAPITDPQLCRRILPHLIKTGAAPPGLDVSALV
jgi:hypothetical protein